MNKRKGLTLVEVLVSITVFLTVFMGILSTYYLTQKRIAKQEEYQYLENICLDIDKVYDTEGIEGINSRFNFNIKDENDGDLTSTTNECEDEDKIPEDYSIDEETQSQSDYVIETVTDSEKTRKYTITYLTKYSYESIDKKIVTTTQKMKNNSSGYLYLDSNYKFVEETEQYKYILSYSYSRNYSIVTEVTTEVTTYKNKTETYTESITEYRKKKNSESKESNKNDESSGDTSSDPLNGYEEETDKRKSVKSDVDTQESESIKTITTTKITKPYELKSSKLTITITNNLNNYVVIDSLDYGSSYYDDKYLYEYEEITKKGETSND